MVRHALSWLAAPRSSRSLLVSAVRGAGVEPSRARRGLDETEGGRDRRIRRQRRSKQPQRTTVTENEVNAYLAYRGAAISCRRRRRTGHHHPRRRPHVGPRRRRSRCGQESERRAEPAGPDEAISPAAAGDGDRVAAASNGVGRLRARIGQRRRAADPEVAAAGDRRLLLESPGESGRHQPRRPVCAAGPHSRDSGRSAVTRNESFSSAARGVGPLFR